MPAKPNNEKGKRKKKPGKPSGKSARELKEQAKNSRKKKATVYYPVIIPKKDEPAEEILCESELSYKEALIAVEIEKLAAKGCTNDEIIAALDVARSTFYDWLRDKPYFSYVLMKHRELANIEVESALFNNAKGFQYFEQAVTPGGKIVNLLKQKLPETKAIEFYLTNRRSGQWKKKVETTLEMGQGLSAITFSIKRYEE